MRIPISETITVGIRFIKNFSSYKYTNYCFRDTAFIRSSEIYNGNSYNYKATSLYWSGHVILYPRELSYHRNSSVTWIYRLFPGPLLLTWINLNPAWKNKKIITFIIRWEKKLLIHSQTSTVQPLKFGNIQVISSHTLRDMWLLIQAGDKKNHVC